MGSSSSIPATELEVRSTLKVRMQNTNEKDSLFQHEDDSRKATVENEDASGNPNGITKEAYLI